MIDRIKNMYNKFKNKIDFDNLEFLAHSKNYVFANLFSQGIAFLTVPIFTRLMTIQDYGIYSIFTSIISIFTVIMLLNTNRGIARYFFEKKDDLDEVLGTNLLFWFLTNIFFIALLWVFKEPISQLININSSVFYFAIIISSLSGIIRIYLEYLQFNRLSKKYVRFEILKNLMIVALSLVFIFTISGDKYWSRIYSRIIVIIIFSIFALYKLIKVSKLKLDFSHIKYTLKIGIPLVPFALSGIILTTFDRLIINQINGAGDAGIYSFAYTIGMIMNVFVSGMNKSWMPIFYQNLADENFIKIKDLAKKYSKYVYAIAIGLILFSKEITIIMADKKFYPALPIIPIIILAYMCVFLFNIYSNYTFYRKKTIFISINTLIAATINIALNYIFIPEYGYIAAAYTTLFSYIVLFILQYTNVKYILKEKNIVPLKTIFSSIVPVLISVLLYYVFENLIDAYAIEIIVKIIYAAVIFIIYFPIKKLFKSKSK